MHICLHVVLYYTIMLHAGIWPKVILLICTPLKFATMAAAIASQIAMGMTVEWCETCWHAGRSTLAEPQLYLRVGANYTSFCQPCAQTYSLNKGTHYGPVGRGVDENWGSNRISPFDMCCSKMPTQKDA